MARQFKTAWRHVKDPKVGEVLAYHPILTRTDHVWITVETEPYALGDGTLIVKARRADGRAVYPCTEALERAERLHETIVSDSKAAHGY
jgi:hypothetical protein